MFSEVYFYSFFIEKKNRALVRINSKILWDLMTVIKVKIIWLILSVENLFSMKTVNSAQLVLWGLEEFWERQRDGKLEGGNDTFIKVAGVQTKECGHLTPDSKHHRFFYFQKR